MGDGWKIDIKLKRPFPFTIDLLFVEPYGSCEEADIFCKVVIKTHPTTTDRILSGRIVRSQDKLLLLITLLILSWEKSTIEPDHKALVFPIPMFIYQCSTIPNIGTRE